MVEDVGLDEDRKKKNKKEIEDEEKQERIERVRKEEMEKRREEKYEEATALNTSRDHRQVLRQEPGSLKL